MAPILSLGHDGPSTGITEVAFWLVLAPHPPPPTPRVGPDCSSLFPPSRRRDPVSQCMSSCSRPSSAPGPLALHAGPSGHSAHCSSHAGLSVVQGLSTLSAIRLCQVHPHHLTNTGPGTRLLSPGSHPVCLLLTARISFSHTTRCTIYSVHCSVCEGPRVSSSPRPAHTGLISARFRSERTAQTYSSRERHQTSLAQSP